MEPRERRPLIAFGLRQRVQPSGAASPGAGPRPPAKPAPEPLQARIAEYADAGLDLLLLQMSPQAEEMERFAVRMMGIPDRAHHAHGPRAGRRQPALSATSDAFR